MSTSANKLNTEEDCFVDQIRREIQNGHTTRARKAIIRANLLILLNRPSLESPQPLLIIENAVGLTAMVRSEPSRKNSYRKVLDDLSAWEVMDDQISLNKNNEKNDLNDEYSDDQNEYWEESFEYVDEEDSICLNDWVSVIGEVEDVAGWEEIRQQTEGLMKVLEIQEKVEDVK